MYTEQLILLQQAVYLNLSLVHLSVSSEFSTAAKEHQLGVKSLRLLLGTEAPVTPNNNNLSFLSA